jgi:hypothetical protein
MSPLALFDSSQNSRLGIQRICFSQLILLHILLDKSPSDYCKWKFHHYSPSPWESYWHDNITTLQNKVCSTLMRADQMEKSVSALEYITRLQGNIFHHSSIPKEYDQLFSKMYYQYECTRSWQPTTLVSQYIEPLVGLLRDPLTICPYKNRSEDKLEDEPALQSKRFFLLGPSAPYQNFRASVPSIAPWLHREGSQKILFDIGSSYFNGVENGTSESTFGMRWFYEYFRQNSLEFDRIIAFEITQYYPKKYWDQIPDDIIGKLTFINVGVNPKGKYSPWKILKSTVKHADYVIVKLDIDRKLLESNLINQVLTDRSISSLIDEMFFEMHVTVNEMIPYWSFQPGELKDSYTLFTKLRQLGIRMHSWP